MEIDQEWVDLISEARSLGFKKEEISAFLNGNALRFHQRRASEANYQTHPYKQRLTWLFIGVIIRIDFCKSSIFKLFTPGLCRQTIKLLLFFVFSPFIEFDEFPELLFRHAGIHGFLHDFHPVIVQGFLVWCIVKEGINRNVQHGGDFSRN